MTSTDIVLINPAAAHGIYGPLGDSLIAVEPPLWLRLTAAYLEARGHRVRTLDAEMLKLSPARTAAEVEKLDPRYVGVVIFGHQPSASTQQMHGAREVAVALKAANSERPIVFAGGHVSALPERTLREEPVDFVIKGEGPITFDLLLKGMPKEDIPGLGYYIDDKIIINAPALALNPATDLKAQGWHFAHPGYYVAHNWHAFGYPEEDRRPYASVFTSLNCPYHCSFCCISAPFGGSGYKMRKPEQVVDEIEMLVNSAGVHFIKIIDEMYILRKSHYMAIAQGLIDRGLGDKINIWAYARVDTIKGEEELATLRKAGFRWLAIGVESGSKHVRDGAEKALKNDDIVGAIARIRSQGINVISNFIVGLPDDTMETMEETYQLAAELNCEFMNVYSGMCYPGSALYTEAIARGDDVSSDWRTYSQHNEWSRPMGSATVSPAEVLRFRDLFFRRYYSRPAYVKMIRGKFGESAVEQVQKMMKYHLKRQLLV